ncbi:MAG: leucine-rich repeat domain-containing protein, partial [Firmicutes bacterium]|nr:leucine-rich repeat domain-containing protein [Bacillota bacterium]
MRYLITLSLMFVICVTSISIGAGILLTRDAGAGEGEMIVVRLNLPEHFDIETDGTNAAIIGISTEGWDLFDSTVNFWEQSAYIDIPSMIDGYHITTIRTGAFSEVLIQELLFPSTLVSIESGAFQFCHIFNMTIPSNLVDIDLRAFSFAFLERIFIEKGVVINTVGYLVDLGMTVEDTLNWVGGVIVNIDDEDFVYLWDMYFPIAFIDPFSYQYVGFHDGTTRFVEYDEKPNTWGEGWNFAGHHVVWGWPNFKFDLWLDLGSGYLISEEDDDFVMQERRWGTNQSLPIPTRPGFEFKGWMLGDWLTEMPVILVNEDSEPVPVEFDEYTTGRYILPYDAVFSHWIAKYDDANYGWIISEQEAKEIAYRGWVWLHAIWEAETFTVSFYLNPADTLLGGINIPSSFQHESGNSLWGIPNLPLSIPSIPSHPTRVFLGFWDTANTTGGMQIFNRYGQPAFIDGWTVVGDTRLYARFGIGAMHTVSFNTGLSDSEISPQSVEHGTHASRPP